MLKICPEGKVLNPKTNRCVKKDGKIGKKILSSLVSRKASRKTSRKVSKKANRKASRKASRKVSRKASRKVSRKVSKKANRNTSKKASKKNEKEFQIIANNLFGIGRWTIKYTIDEKYITIKGKLKNKQLENLIGSKIKPSKNKNVKIIVYKNGQVVSITFHLKENELNYKRSITRPIQKLPENWQELIEMIKKTPRKASIKTSKKVSRKVSRKVTKKTKKDSRKLSRKLSQKVSRKGARQLKLIEGQGYSVLAKFSNTIFDLSDGFEIDEKEEKKFMNKLKKEASKHDIKIISSQMGADDDKLMYLDAVVHGKKTNIIKLLSHMKSVQTKIELINYN